MALFYCSICLPRNPAADCISLRSTSPIPIFLSFPKRMTAPITSPSQMMGHTASDTHPSVPATAGSTKFLSPLSAMRISRFSNSSSISLPSAFPDAPLSLPAAAMIWSRSAISAVYPDTCARLSAYCFANALISPIGEYFFKITSPSHPVNISRGSASRIRRVRRISFGITILPRSSHYVK